MFTSEPVPDQAFHTEGQIGDLEAQTSFADSSDANDQVEIVR